MTASVFTLYWKFPTILWFLPLRSYHSIWKFHRIIRCLDEWLYIKGQIPWWKRKQLWGQLVTQIHKHQFIILVNNLPLFGSYNTNNQIILGCISSWSSVEMLSVLAPLMINNVIVNYERWYSPLHIITCNTYMYVRALHIAFTCICLSVHCFARAYVRALLARSYVCTCFAYCLHV